MGEGAIVGTEGQTIDSCYAEIEFRMTPQYWNLTPLTVFGLLAVIAGLVCYALERHSHWYTLGFSVACILGAVYGFLQGAWPFGFVEVIWTIVTFRRWLVQRKHGV
jgi:hypothetical protein